MENSIKKSKSIISEVKDWFVSLFDLESGSDREGTIIYIKNNKRVRGANAWMLICSIMIASLGLDLGSPAVIIGAMLISPLMSPILGIGLGVAINDKDTLLISLQHFGISILIALVTSTLYFSITPFGDITPEIESRTSPTFLDGLVAIFGGLAGIISTTRKDKSNAIPGVAIATALMPPLCVTGFGLANFRELGTDVAWGIAQNSFYLFFLNSFFIALTAYLIIKLLNFPLRTYVNKAEAQRNRIILLFFSLLVIVPSVRILLNIYKERQTREIVEAFISEQINRGANRYCSIFETGRESGKQIFYLDTKGRPIPADSMKYFQQMFESESKLSNVELVFYSGVNQEELKKIDLRFKNIEEIQEEMQETKKLSSQQDLRIQDLEQQLDSLYNSYRISEVTFKIAKEAFPNLKSLYFARAQTQVQDSTSQSIPLIIYSWKNNRANSRERKRLYNTIIAATNLDTLKMVRE